MKKIIILMGITIVFLMGFICGNCFYNPQNNNLLLFDKAKAQDGNHQFLEYNGVENSAIINSSISPSPNYPAPQIPDVIKARKFLLVDQYNNKRGEWVQNSDITGLIIYDKHGKEKFNLSLAPQNTYFAFKDQFGSTRIKFSIYNNNASLEFKDKYGTPSYFIEKLVNNMGNNIVSYPPIPIPVPTPHTEVKAGEEFVSTTVKDLELIWNQLYIITDRLNKITGN